MKYIILFISLLFVGCTPPMFGDFHDPDLPISYSFETVEEIWQYVSSITYVEDEFIWRQAQYVQSPWQTYLMQTGDCEDIAILMMHLMDRLGEITRFITISLDGGSSYHAVVLYNDQLLEPSIVGMYHGRQKAYFNWSYEQVIRSCEVNKGR